MQLAPPTFLGKESVVIGLNGRKLGYIYPPQRGGRHVSLRRRRSLTPTQVGFKVPTLRESGGHGGTAGTLAISTPQRGIDMSVCAGAAPSHPTV